MGIDSDGYNIFAVGPTGTGKTSTVYDFLKKQAASHPAPDDWIYVYNFTKADVPNAIRMPPGKAQAFKKDMEKLVQDLQAAISQAFDGEEYDARLEQNGWDEVGFDDSKWAKAQVVEPPGGAGAAAR